MFTRDERRLFKEKLKEEVEKPGPGFYQIVSEFGAYEPPKFNGFLNSSVTINKTVY